MKFNKIIVLTVGLMLCNGAAAMNKFNPQSLNDFQQAQFTAGVLPYFKSKSGTKYVVLSREASGNDKGEWDAFSGLSDPLKNSSKYEHPTDAAGREFFEEAILASTLGWDLATTQKYIKVGDNNTKRVIGRYGGGKGRFLYYETNLGFDNIKKLINKFDSARTNASSSKYKEKDALIVVKYKDLQKAIKNGNPRIQLSSLKIATDKNNNEMKVVAQNKPSIGNSITLRGTLFNTLRAHYDTSNSAYVFDKKFNKVLLYKK